MNSITKTENSQADTFIDNDASSQRNAIERLNHLLDVCHIQIMMLQSENAILVDKLNKAISNEANQKSKNIFKRIFTYLHARGVKATLKAILRKFGVGNK